jgi:hypothetical protein
MEIYKQPQAVVRNYQLVCRSLSLLLKQEELGPLFWGYDFSNCNGRSAFSFQVTRFDKFSKLEQRTSHVIVDVSLKIEPRRGS